VDPLSKMLAMMDLRAAQPSRFEASGPWSLRFSGYHQHVKVGAVLAGRCWLAADGRPTVSLSAGDCYLLSSSLPFTASSHPGLAPVDGTRLYEEIWPKTVLKLNETDGDPDRFVQVCGVITFDGVTADLLLDHLPDCAVVDARDPGAGVLAPTLKLLAAEDDDSAAGAAVMREELTKVLFVQVVRTLLLSGDTGGWVQALSDPKLGAALALVHKDPAHPWTLAELAAGATMSRSAFAQHFTDVVGLPPLAYVSRLRVRQAGRMLRTTDRTVSSIAGAVGYASEGAFTHAFKRLTGKTPSDYRRTPAVSAGGAG
jgi:AraC-like DNA-binding protein